MSLFPPLYLTQVLHQRHLTRCLTFQTCEGSLVLRCHPRHHFLKFWEKTNQFSNGGKRSSLMGQEQPNLATGQKKSVRGQKQQKKTFHWHFIGKATVPQSLHKSFSNTGSSNCRHAETRFNGLSTVFNTSSNSFSSNKFWATFFSSFKNYLVAVDAGYYSTVFQASIQRNWISVIFRFCIYIGRHNYSLPFLFNRNLITRDFWEDIIGFARTASRDGVREDAAREDAVRSDAARADSDGADEARADAAGAYAARPEYFFLTPI